jgi:hypothetical protein
MLRMSDGMQAVVIFLGLMSALWLIMFTFDIVWPSNTERERGERDLRRTK